MLTVFWQVMMLSLHVPVAGPIARPAAIPALKPLEFAADWSGTIVNLKLRDAAPHTDHFITDPATWSKLWKAWRAEEKVPEVDFHKEVVFVFTALAPNIPCLKLYSSSGHVTGTVGRTCKGGPGFGYRIVKLPKAGITSFFGQAIP